MFQDLFRGNFFNTAQISELENKLTDLNYPLEEFLKDDSAISCVKSMGKNTQKYFNPEKIKQLIKLITEEPETEDQLRGHKFPYVACEILKSNCPFILQRFVLNEQEYDEEYPDNNSEDEKEIDFDFCKNDVEKEYSKIEEKIKNLKNADNSKDGDEEKNIIEKDNDINNDNKNEENENSNNLNKNENKDTNEGIKEDERKEKENNAEEKKEEANNSNKENNEENNKKVNNKDQIKDKNDEENNEKQENNKDEKDKKEEIKNENNENDNKEKIEETNENKKKEELKSSSDIEEKKEDNKEEKENKEENKEEKKEKENKEENKNKDEKKNEGIEEPKEEKNLKDKEENESNSKENKDIKEKDEPQENLGKEKVENEDMTTNENKEEENKEELEEKNIIKEENNKNEELEDKREQQKEQEQKKIEEIGNIETMEEKEENVINDNKLNSNENEVEINLKKEEDSLSIEGEIEDIYAKKPKPKKKYENKPNNEYLDLLLNFVMSDKAEFNYVLSGYFANVMIILIDKYPSQVLKYLYTIRKDALRKIVFHSHQKAFAILSLKILNLEILFIQDRKFEDSFKDISTESINFRNELIGEIIKSVSLEGIKDDKNEINNEIDLEAKFGLVFEMIYENKKVIKYLVFNNDIYSHLFDILDTDLYNNDTKTENNESNFDNKYNIYSLYIVLITKLLKDACSNYLINYPNEFDLNSIKKPKKELTFSENMILTFGKILKNNFLPKKPTLILEKYSTIPYEGLGMLNIKIMELVKEMLNFMKQLPKQFDSILIRNNFYQRSIDYFFKYQWNNIYHIQFVEFFNLYLSEEERHKELTEYLFGHIKFHKVLINYLNQDNIDEKDIDKIIPKQRLKFSFKSGKKINSGVYSHVIDLIYKIQAISGLDIFTEEEKSELKIKNYGEFEFSKDEKSNKLLRKINISNNIQNILKKSKLWNEITKSTVIPLIKKYETQLCKKEEKKGSDDNELDELEYLMPKRNSMGASNYLFQQLISIIKKETNSKRFSLPLSRNDKNENKAKNDKSSIREKLLNKGGFNNKKIFEDDDNDIDNKKEENKNIKTENEDDKTYDSESNNKYNDTNYWEVKNALPEKIKKEVDKKTNIIFNYNPTTYELNNKEVSEEDELLSIAMGLEQNEKTEKNKKIMYIIPGKSKPINLKAKKNPVQSIFTSIDSSNNENIEDDSLKKKDKEKILEDNEDKDNKQNENEENEEEEEAIIKNDEDKSKEEKKDSDENIEKDNDNDNDKIYNDVNYWSIGNYLNEKEMEDCLKDL